MSAQTKTIFVGAADQKLASEEDEVRQRRAKKMSDVTKKVSPN
jgi:hypothetical protein